MDGTRQMAIDGRHCHRQHCDRRPTKAASKADQKADQTRTVMWNKILMPFDFDKTLDPHPPKTRTRITGTGFAGVRVWVALDIPQGYPCHALAST